MSLLCVIDGSLSYCSLYLFSHAKLHLSFLCCYLLSSPIIFPHPPSPNLFLPSSLPPSLFLLLTPRFYKGLVPLWMRQIPYTMTKFAAFERTVEFLYKYVVTVPRDSLSKGNQLVVTFAAGYIAGVFCALVSHPADSVVSKLNSNKGSTALQIAKMLGWKG